MLATRADAKDGSPRRAVVRVVPACLLWSAVCLLAMNAATTVMGIQYAQVHWALALRSGALEITYWPDADANNRIQGWSAYSLPPAWRAFHFRLGRAANGERVVAAPVWVFALAAAGSGLALSCRGRRKLSHCTNCEYDLSGNRMERCPECGVCVPADSARADGRPRGAARRRAVPVQLVLIVSTVALMGGGYASYQMWAWITRTHAIIVIPAGYRGEILIVREHGGSQPRHSWRTYTYEVPPSGVVRAHRLDVLDTYGGSHQVTCRESDGTSIPAWHGEESSTVSYYLRGDVHLFRLSVRNGNEHKEFLIPPGLFEEFLARGVPQDYMAPREKR